MTLNPEWIGFVAGVLTTTSYAPQVWHCFRSKQVEGISLGMYVVLTLGVSLWLVYGVMISSLSMMIANAVALIMIITILIMRIRYHPRRNHPNPNHEKTAQNASPEHN